MRIETRPATGLLQPTTSSKSRLGRWLLTPAAVVNVLLVAVMIAVVWGSIALHLMQQRGEVERRAERESNNLAQAAAESVGQTIAGVDSALRLMRAIYLADPRHLISAPGRIASTRHVRSRWNSL